MEVLAIFQRDARHVSSRPCWQRPCPRCWGVDHAPSGLFKLIPCQTLKEPKHPKRFGSNHKNTSEPPKKNNPGRGMWFPPKKKRQKKAPCETAQEPAQALWRGFPKTIGSLLAGSSPPLRPAAQASASPAFLSHACRVSWGWPLKELKNSVLGRHSWPCWYEGTPKGKPRPVLKTACGVYDFVVGPPFVVRKGKPKGNLLMRL